MINLSVYQIGMHFGPYFISLIFSLYYLIKFNYKLLFKEKVTTVRKLFNANSSIFFQTYIKYQVIFIVLINYTIYNYSYPYHGSFGGLKKFEILFLSLYILILTIVRLNLYWIFFSYFYLCTSVWVLYTTNLLNLYLLIEMQFYLFILLTLVQNLLKKRNSPTNETLINMFILNFFTSIFFFIVISYSLYLYGEFTMHYFYDFYQINMFFFIFLIKSSAGPWLLLNTEIYKGVQLNTLLLYTIGFFTILMPKLYLVLLCYSSVVSKSLFCLIFINYYGYIALTIHNIKSIKMFLAYSTSVYYSYIILVHLFYVISY